MNNKNCDKENKAIREILSEIQIINGEKNAIIMSKVGKNLASRWIDSVEAETPEILLGKIGEYFKEDFNLCDITEINFENRKINVHIEGCKPCCGNLVKQKGGKAACPISSFILTALKTKFPNLKKIQLNEIQKTNDTLTGEPIVGLCDQIISIHT